MISVYAGAFLKGSPMFFPDDGEKLQIKKLAEGHFRNLLYKFFRRQDFSKQTFLYRFVKD